MSSNQAVTVSQLNSYIKATFEQDINLRNLYVCGEISNFKRHSPSGHLYFSLKDSKSLVRAVMFAGQAKNIQFDIKDGMNVVVFGRVSCYEASGQYQIYVEKIQPDGIGSVYLAFEQLKTKLMEEGLFDLELKKPIPRYPRKLGVVTSRTGAVIHDIKTVSAKRYPLCEIVLYPTEVQGEKAENEIVNAIEYFNQKSDVDVIIVGRGGGSIEDLWAFNKESVARAIAASRIPIISAVGHETDFTICDFVADVRAATPSAAAEIALPDAGNIKTMIDDRVNRCDILIQSIISDYTHILQASLDDLHLCGIEAQIDLNLVKVKNLRDRLKQLCSMRFNDCHHRYEVFERQLRLCSEESILRRGFSRIISDDNKSVEYENIKDNMKVRVKMSGGIFECILTNVKKDGETDNGKEKDEF